MPGTGTWVRRHADQHRCPTPDPLPKDTRPGDIWRCDECAVEWQVHEHQLDGMHLIVIPNTGNPNRH